MIEIFWQLEAFCYFEIEIVIFEIEANLMRKFQDVLSFLFVESEWLVSITFHSFSYRFL